jgi:hypothetical protein
MRWLTIALAVVAFAFAGAGCGGGDDESSSDTVAVTDSVSTDEETTDETTTDEETTTDGETTDDTDTDVTGGFDFSSEECRDLLNASTAFSQAIGAASSGQGSDLTDAADAFQEFADNVPEEIRADVQVLAEVYAKYAEVFADIDLQAGETPTAEQIAQLSQAFQSIDTEEASAASERIGTWAQENCSS